MATASAPQSTSAAGTPAPFQSYGLPLNDLWDLAYDGVSLLALFDGQLVRLQSVEGENRFRATEQQKGFASAWALAWDAAKKQYWVIGRDVDLTGEFSLRDQAGAELTRFKAPAEAVGIHLAWDGKYLWAASGQKPIYKLTPNDATGTLDIVDSYGVELGHFPGEAVQGLVWAGDNLWTLSYGMLTKLDRSMKIVCREDLDTSFPSGASWWGTRGLAWDGAYLWAGHHDANLVLRVDPALCKK